MQTVAHPHGMVRVRVRVRIRVRPKNRPGPARPGRDLETVITSGVARAWR